MNKNYKVIIIRTSDSEQQTIRNKSNLRALLEWGYEISKTDLADGIITYILTK